jgi:hypothetical protein
MRHMTFALVAIAAVAAMALLGASSAMANFPTTLCNEESASLECPPEKQIELETFAAGVTTLATSLATILCLHSVAKAEVELEATGGALLTEAGTPLPVLLEPKTSENPQGGLTFEECGTASGGEAHNSCTVTVEQLPLLQILKTAVDLGTLKFNPALSAKIHLVCGSTINCEFSEPKEGKALTVESAGHTIGSGNGMLTANELEVQKLAGGLFCPKVSKWTALYEPLTPVWLRS